MIVQPVHGMNIEGSSIHHHRTALGFAFHSHIGLCDMPGHEGDQ